MKQPALVEEQLSAGNNDKRTEELTKRVKSSRQKIDQAEAKIRRIHEGYEAEPPVYTAKEAEERIRALRDLIAWMETELQRLQTLFEQEVIGQKTIDIVRRRLEEVRDENLEKASFSEKQELIARLGIAVYPSEDHRTVRIASKLPVVGDKISTQIMSMASPKL
jgi:multidrug resistance efflux pump